jgi:hypothetical protein
MTALLYLVVGALSASTIVGVIGLIRPRRPRLVLSVLLALLVTSLAGVLFWPQPNGTKTVAANDSPDQQELVRLIPTATAATTDMRRTVALFLYGEPVPRDITPVDKRFISTVPGGLLFTGYHGGYNCHGWIFTGGRFWIMNDAVPAILSDNGYHQITDPRVGDLIVYWDESRQPIHSGIVQAVPPKGPIRVESKWGMRGQFMHTPQGQIFSQSFSFLRSSRRGHLLQGLEESPPLAE